MEAIVERIESILDSCSEPSFTVLCGEPLGLPLGDRVCCFWYTGEKQKEETFGNVMVWQTYQVRLYWVLRPERSSQRALDIEMQIAARKVQALLWDDATLGGLIANMNLGLVRRGLQNIAASDYQVIEFELNVWQPEEEGISL